MSNSTLAATRNTRLSEDDVRKRLSLCEDKEEVVDELYDFGLTLQNEVADRIKVVESKAVSFAAYGAAVETLLVSSAVFWQRLGDKWTPWASAFAGLSGMMCTVFSLRALWLREYDFISEDEWLQPECLVELHKLKMYRILTLWRTIHSHSAAQSKKARELQRAQVWLAGSAVFLFYLLLYVAFLMILERPFWIHLWKRTIQSNLGIRGWENCGGVACAVILGSTLAGFIWRTFRVRLI